MTDFAEIVDYSECKRAMVIAASGGFSIVLLGAEQATDRLLMAFPTIVPDDSGNPARRISLVHPDVEMRQLKGTRSKAGALQVAHGGVVLMRALHQHSEDIWSLVLDAHETGHCRRWDGPVRQTRFDLATSLTLCPCGLGPEPGCDCTSKARSAHLRSVRPFLEAAGMVVLVRPSAVEDPGAALESHQALFLVDAARHRGFNRSNALNARSPIDSQWIEQAWLTQGAKDQLSEIEAQVPGWSSQARSRLVRVAVTIADLDQRLSAREQHLAEALALDWRLTEDFRQSP